MKTFPLSRKDFGPISDCFFEGAGKEPNLTFFRNAYETLKTINIAHDFEIPAGMPFNRSSAFVELLRGLVVSYLEKPQLGLKHTSSP